MLKNLLELKGVKKLTKQELILSKGSGAQVGSRVCVQVGPKCAVTTCFAPGQTRTLIEFGRCCSNGTGRCIYA